MAVCTKCGTQITEGNRICFVCGTIVRDAEQKIDLPPSVPAAALPATIKTLENFALIKSGTFMMSSPSGEPRRNDDEGRQHKVTVSSFYICKYQVTQSEYQKVMGVNPSNFKGDNLPVEMVSWYDAVEYCNRLSLKDALSPAYNLLGSANPDDWGAKGAKWDSVKIIPGSNGYRLPTEAQWEYACRAGSSTPFSTGDIITSDQANYDGTSTYNNSAKGIFRQKTMPVGSFQANQWGLYDMHGNVWEWCWDWYGDYKSEMQIDPAGPDSGTTRVERGGAWSSGAYNLRSACRSYDFPSIRGYIDGFRLALPL